MIEKFTVREASGLRSAFVGRFATLAMAERVAAALSRDSVIYCVAVFEAVAPNVVVMRSQFCRGEKLARSDRKAVTA